VLTQSTSDEHEGGPRRQPAFVGLVAGTFATRIGQSVLAIVVSFTLARLLGPDGRGVYFTLTLIPATLYALATFGLPSSLTVFSGRGAPVQPMVLKTIVLGIAASSWLIGGIVLLLPILATTVLRSVPIDLLPWILAAIPLQLTGSFAGNVLFGRQRIRAYNVIALVQGVSTLALVVALVGVLHLGVPGALAAYLVTASWGGLLLLLELRRQAGQSTSQGADAGYRTILGYGIGLYPGVLSSFFNLRADIYLLSGLLGSASAIGLYSLAVSLAEIVFYVPDSVSSIFMPRVAAVGREASAARVAEVTRLTFLVTAIVAIALAPACIVAIRVVLPAFTGSIMPLLVLLPAVVILSLSRVLSGYLVGIGIPRPTVVASIASLVLNVGANLALIPTSGITGAAIASLLSYSVSGGLLLRAASRESGVPASRFVIPRHGDAGRVAGVVRSALAMLPRWRRTRGAEG
jgi:O-antigen/teichoic acid export membrane protein